MDRVKALHLIKVLGDQALPESERWKSISHVFCGDNIQLGYNISKKIKEGKLIFIDSPITVDTTNEKLTGFYVLESSVNEVDFNAEFEHVTFVPIEAVIGMSFWNSTIDNNKRVQQIKNLNTFYTNTYK